MNKNIQMALIAAHPNAGVSLCWWQYSASLYPPPSVILVLARISSEATQRLARLANQPSFFPSIHSLFRLIYSLWVLSTRRVEILS